MPVSVVSKYPSRHLDRRLLLAASTVVGGLLLFVALLASALVLPLGVLVVGVIAGESMDAVPASDGRIVLAAVLCVTAIAFGGVGVRLLRGKRVGILFLRRFGYDDATRVATFAAAKTIGRSWRIVTLDDAEVAPLGVSAGPSMLLRTVGIGRPLRRLRPLFRARTLKVAAALPVVILAIAVVKIELVQHGGSYEPFGDVLNELGSGLGEGRIAVSAIDWSLPGALAASLIALAVAFLVSCLWLVVLLVSIPLMGISGALSSARDAARTADGLQRLEISEVKSIDLVASILAEGTQKIFAPRIIVVRVAHDAWRETVMRLSALAPLTVVDVSDPSDNLLWEIEQLAAAELASRCVFVGQSERVAALANGAGARDAHEERLAVLLDGHEVLAYTSDRRGTGRFARALRTRLMDAEQAARHERGVAAEA